MGFRLTLTEDRTKALSSKIGQLIEDALRDRKDIEREWDDNNNQYNGKLAPTSFPWPGASNYFVPLTETYVNAIAGRMVDAIHAPEPVYTIRNVSNQWLNGARAAQDMMEYMQREVLQLRKFSDNYIFRMVKHGTAWAFLPWQVLLEKRLRYDPAQDDVIQELDTKQVGPKVFSPHLPDILVPKDALNLGVAPWRAHRVRLTQDDMALRELSGAWEPGPAKEVLKFADQEPDEATKRRIMMEGFSTTKFENFHEIWTWWGLFHLPGHKYATHLIVPYHLPTKTVLAAQVNWYPHQFEPYFSTQYQQNEQGIYGRGVCRMVRSGNREVNDLHKHRVDNAMVANTRLWKVQASTYTQLPKGFRLWPGRMLPVNTMQDIEGLAMADVYQSTLEEELLTRRTNEQLIGLSDFSLSGGAAGDLRRIGATTALAAIQESGRTMNYRLNNVRETYAEMGSWTFEMLAHFRPTALFRHVLGVQGAAHLEELMDQPEEAIRGRMLIELTASSATINSEVDKNTDMVLINIMSQYYTQYFQLAERLSDPQLPEELKEIGISMARGINELMKDILRDFNKRNSALILTELADVFDGSGGPGGASTLGGVPLEAAGQAGGLLSAAAQRDGLGGAISSAGPLVRAGRSARTSEAV